MVFQSAIFLDKEKSVRTDLTERNKEDWKMMKFHHYCLQNGDLVT